MCIFLVILLKSIKFISGGQFLCTILGYTGTCTLHCYIWNSWFTFIYPVHLTICRRVCQIELYQLTYTAVSNIIMLHFKLWWSWNKTIYMLFYLELLAFSNKSFLNYERSSERRVINFFIIYAFSCSVLQLNHCYCFIQLKWEQRFYEGGSYKSEIVTLLG